MNALLQSSSQQTWLWIGTIGMALGAVVIYALGSKGSQHHRVASVFVCAIAACMYLLMAFGQGDVIVTQDNLFFTPDGVVDVESASLVYWARYLDWVFTTPLLLIGLLTLGLRAVSGQGEAVRDRLGLVAGVVGADVLMIITGLFGALSMNSQHKYIWFAISCGFFLAVIAAVWGPVRAAAAEQGGGVAALYTKLAGILTVLWFIYPILWLLGTEGTGTISLDLEVIVFTIIDLTAKVGFGILLVTGVSKLGTHAANHA
jgi:bacteriorhodopsin